MLNLTKGKVTAIICGVFAIICLCLLGSIGEDVKNERIVVNQYPFSGKMAYWTDPGFRWQWFGHTTEYYKTQQFWFGGKDVEGESHGTPIKVQPANQNENHHNIVTMKRATPSPWYGFQLRHSSTNKLIIIGTCFSNGTNTNTNIQPSWVVNNKVGEYNLTITYNPLASTNKFVCYNELTQANVYTSNSTFPDIDDLKYLRVTIGYAMDEFGHPFRYSNINLQNFSIQRT